MTTRATGVREPMSKVDTAWLRMESPTNLMMITGLLFLNKRMEPRKLKRVIAERFLAFPRFRQKAVDEGNAAFWQTDIDFDMDWHVRVAALPGTGDKAALEKYTSELASTALDHSRPLWQFHLIENYDGGSVLLSRIHHCYADGLALVQVMLSLTDAAPKPEKRAPLAKAWLKRDQGGVVFEIEGKAVALRHDGKFRLESGKWKTENGKRRKLVFHFRSCVVHCENRI